MKAEETDLFFKKMIASSSLEIGKPDFNSIIMQKIMLQEKKKMMRRAILCSFLGVITLGLVIFLLITTMKPSTQIIPSMLEGIIHWLPANEFLLLPILLVLLIQKITGGKAKHAYPMTQK